MKKIVFFILILLSLILEMSCKNNTTNEKSKRAYVLVDTTKFEVIPKNKYYLVDTTYSTYYPTPKEPYNVLILTVPPERQPYATPAYHFWNTKGEMVVFVSTSKPMWNQYLSFHEITEAMQCIKHGIPQTAMVSFDRQWVPVPGSGIEEPGADPTCPYHIPHMKALQVEHVASDVDDNDWELYNNEMYRLQQPAKLQK